jgi:hypothetical protein
MSRRRTILRDHSRRPLPPSLVLEFSDAAAEASPVVDAPQTRQATHRRSE